MSQHFWSRLAILGYAEVTYAIAVFHQHVVVAANCDQEENDLDVVENVDPLLTFRPLSTDIEHAVRQVTSVKDSLADTSRS